MKCHVPPRFAAAGLSPFTAAGSDRPFYIPCFFAPALPSEAAPPARTAQTAARRKRILFIYCSYASVKRILRRRRSGSGLGISPAKGQGPRRRPMFRLFRVSQRNPLQRGKCRSEAEAMGVFWSAARTAFRRCAAGAAPTPPGAQKARRPPLLKKGRNSAAASEQALLDAPSAGSYVPPLRTGAEAAPARRLGRP